MELLSHKNPTAEEIKSNNELFQLTSASVELFSKYELMAAGKYIAAPKEKNKVCIVVLCMCGETSVFIRCHGYKI